MLLNQNIFSMFSKCYFFESMRTTYVKIKTLMDEDWDNIGDSFVEQIGSMLKPKQITMSLYSLCIVLPSQNRKGW